MSDVNGVPWGRVPEWPTCCYGLAIDLRSDPTRGAPVAFDREAFLYLGADAMRRFVDGGLMVGASYALRLVYRDDDGAEFQLTRIDAP